MDMSRIAGAGEGAELVSAGDAARHLDTSMAGLETCFRTVGESLAASIGTIDRMASGLDEIRRSLAPETAGAAVERLRRVAHRLRTLPDAQRRRADEIDTLTTRTRELRAMLAEIRTILDLLGIYGMNIKITSSGEAAFVDFVTGMDGKLESGRREIARLTRELDQFNGVVGDVRKADRLLSEEGARAGSHVPDQLTANAGALQEHVDAVVRMTDRVGTIVRTVQAEVARVLGAIQIGDSVRQRAEHCVTILQRIYDPQAGLMPAARAHIERLVEAQLRAMAGDFQQEIDAIVRSLDRLAPLAGQLGELIASHGGGGDGRILEMLEQDIAKLGTVTAQLCEADAHLASLTGFVTQTLGELAQGLERIQHIAVDVQDISTNTRLLSRRHGEKGRAVAVIAKEVAPCATNLDKLRVAVTHQIEALGTIDLVQDGGADDGGLVLNEALAVVRSACDSSGAAMTRGGDEAQGIIAMLQASASDLGDQQSFTQMLLTVADRLSLQSATADGAELTADDEEALRELLPWIARLYTMACERDVHALFVLPGMEAAAPPAPAAVSFDDDDGLF
ncbi:MAG: hypothetical protein PGN23_16480 [Sphingomonas adhaesiva]|uniref:hypothetical protein n=1 Tax=Sphingomonas adhaesiva TaxID=28212 RepID=UPI002FF48FA0